MKEELNTYEALMDENPMVKHVLTPEMSKYMFANNERTVKGLNKTWSGNLRKNVRFYKKHGSFVDAFRGFGINKAVIAVGAGPSFNLNKDVLLNIYRYNLMFPLDKQPFIIVASNKQWKPLLEMGIYPHFVILIDAGDALYPQLCKGIPKDAKKSILVAGLHTSPKIIERWDKNGGQICFYLIGEQSDKKYFEKKTADDAEKIHIQQGGNVLNTLWILSNRVLGSKVYITVGNDLSFPYSKDKKKRREAFYADGDYKLNIANLRDEAKEELGWMGFENLKESSVVPNQILYDLKPVGTSRLLWVYKLWMEVQVAVWAKKHVFQFYNCSEAGILGVLAREYKPGPEMLKDRSNWHLMDDLFPKRWRTRTLEQAFKEFVEAKLWLKNDTRKPGEILVTNTGARFATKWEEPTTIANFIVQNEVKRLTHSGIIL